MKRVLIFLDLSAHAERTKILNEKAFSDEDLGANPELGKLEWPAVLESDPIVIIDADGEEYSMSFEKFKNYCKCDFFPNA